MTAKLKSGRPADDMFEDLQYIVGLDTRWEESMVWEETPFRPSDDVVLLSFGFHFSSDGSSMYLVEEDGDTWSVKIDDAVPIWYHNGKRIGGRSYDDVVNQFGRKKR
jgi:hypothetical protein